MPGRDERGFRLIVCDLWGFKLLHKIVDKRRWFPELSRNFSPRMSFEPFPHPWSVFPKPVRAAQIPDFESPGEIIVFG